VVSGCLVNGGHFTIRKGGGVEARRLMRILVEPEADGVLWLHIRVLLVLIRANAAVSASRALGRFDNSKPSAKRSGSTNTKKNQAKPGERTSKSLLKIR